MSEPVIGASGSPESSLTGVSCVSAAFCVALGESDAGRERFGAIPEKGLGSFSEIWSGSAWTVVPTAGSAGANAGLSAISCVSADFCVAVGQSPAGLSVPHHGASPKGRPLVEVWNGAGWSVEANPAASGILFGVDCRSESFCVAVGASGTEENQPLSEFWNGRRWSLQSPPALRPRFNALQSVSCVAVDACFAVGFHNISPQGQVATVLLAERWDGHKWHAEYPPDHLPAEGVEMYGISCTSRSFCLAAASFAQGNGTVALSPFVERWNGKHWSHASAGLPAFSGLFGISCVTPHYCFAVGQFDPRLQPAAGTTRLLMESWSGTRWSCVEVPPATEPVLPEDSTWIETDPALLGVSCVALVGCTAVGAQAGGGANSAPFAQSEAGAPSAPAEAARAPTPVFGHTATLKTISGAVLVERPGTTSFVPLSAVTSVPLGTIVDTTNGTVKLTAATGAHGGTETGLFYDGLFRLTQTRAPSRLRGGRRVGITILTLTGPATECAASAASRGYQAAAARRLWGNAHGNFQTKGRYASATVRGTKWLTEDTCAGTLVKVARGVVAVEDRRTHKTVVVRAGHSTFVGTPTASASSPPLWSAVGARCGLTEPPAHELLCESKAVPSPPEADCGAEPQPIACQNGEPFVFLAATGQPRLALVSQFLWVGGNTGDPLRLVFTPLAAGRTWSDSSIGVTCSIAEASVRCSNRSAHGFTLTTTSYEAF